MKPIEQQLDDAEAKIERLERELAEAKGVITQHNLCHAAWWEHANLRSWMGVLPIYPSGCSPRAGSNPAAAHPRLSHWR